MAALDRGRLREPGKVLWQQGFDRRRAVAKRGAQMSMSGFSAASGTEVLAESRFLKSLVMLHLDTAVELVTTETGLREREGNVWSIST